MKRPKSRCYCISLRRAASAVSHLYDRHLEPAGITANQFSLLANLDALGTVNVSRFAEHMGLDRTTLVRTLKPLLDRGLVRDTAAPGRRDRQLELTEQARVMLPECYRLWKEAQAEIKSRLGADNVKLLLAMLEQIEELNEEEREAI